LQRRLAAPTCSAVALAQAGALAKARTRAKADNSLFAGIKNLLERRP